MTGSLPVRRRSALAASVLAAALVGLPSLSIDGSGLVPHAAALSETHGRIVFAGNLDRAQHDIYSMRPDGGDVTRLTNASAGGGAALAEDHPVFSPNGTRIVFTSNRDGNPELYVMNADGSNEDRLTDDPSLDVDPAWSSDGARIVFARADPETPDRHRIATVDGNGSNLTTLTSGATDDVDPAWSPNGTRLAFVRDGRLTLMNPDGTGLATLASSLTQVSAPAWSPTGTKLAFGAVVSGRSDVYTINSTGTGLLKLTGSSFPGSSPRWSPDGARIVYAGGSGSGASIATILPDGTCPAQLRIAPAGKLIGAPDWQGLSSAPLFLSSNPGCRSIQRGSSTAFGIGLDWNTARSPVNLAVDGLPAGTTARFAPNPAWLTTATLTISTNECGTATPAGTYTLTITGWVGPMIRTTHVTLVVRDGPPKVTAPRSELVSGTKLSSTVRVNTSWSACDHNPIQSYKSGRWSGNDWFTVTNGNATSVGEYLTHNRTHRYRALATEASFPAGSPYAYGPMFTPTVVQETSVAFTGTWARVTGKKYSGSAARYATGAGAAATYSFTGSSVAWVSAKGPTKGAAQVYVDGVLARTVDLHAADVKAKRVVFAHSWPAAGRHTVRVVVVGTANRPRVDVDGFITLVNASSYVKNTWNGHFATERPENITCVSASALTWVNYTKGITSDEYYSHTIAMDWYRQVRSSSQDFHNKYDYTGIEPGLDPRGWAWLMWRHTGSGRGYHDYWSSSQAAVNSWIVWNIREANEPAGALTFRAIHAVNVVGFSSNIDPRNGVYTLNGFFVVDPWYPNAKSTMKDGGKLGLAPNTFLTLRTWNDSYLLPYRDKPYEAVHGPNLWHGNYVAVLRTVNGTAEPTKTNDAMPPTFSGVGPSSPTAPPAPAAPVEPAFALDDELGAITTGIALNGLEGDQRVGLGGGPIEIGQRVDVDSLSEDMASYSLVEVVQAGSVVAVAMLTRDADGLRFAGLQAASSENPLVSASEARGKLRAQGVDVRSMRAVWQPSADSMAPFSPFWVATDSAGRERYLTPSNSVKPAIEPAVGR